MSIASILRWAAALVALLVFQAITPALWGIKPNLILLLVFLHGLRFGETQGLIFGALSGLILDIYSGGIIGPHTLSKGVVGYGAAWFPGIFFREHRWIITICMVFLTLLDGAILKVVFNSFSPLGGPDIPSVLRQAVIVGLLWTVVDLICNKELTEEQHT